MNLKIMNKDYGNTSTFWNEVNKEIIIFNTSINKIIENGQTIKFWTDRWIKECSLKKYYTLLYETTTNKDITVDRVIGYNRFYLNFNRSLNVVLAQQLESLYIQLSTITLNTEVDIITWRWSNNGLFSVKSYYHWLDFGGIKSFRYINTWTTTISLRIKIFL
jgi:hypothetical protein